LRDTIPPTLPDRLRARGLIETVWIDPHVKAALPNPTDSLKVPRSNTFLKFPY
jgi:hypothetical protein